MICTYLATSALSVETAEAYAVFNPTKALKASGIVPVRELLVRYLMASRVLLVISSA